MSAFQPNARTNPVLFEGLLETITIDTELFSLPMRPGRWGGISIQMVWNTGAPQGIIRLQYSNDKINWSNVTGTDTAVTGPDNVLWIMPDAIVGYIRVHYDFTSGSGTLSGTAVTREG